MLSDAFRVVMKNCCLAWCFGNGVEELLCCLVFFGWRYEIVTLSGVLGMELRNCVVWYLQDKVEGLSYFLVFSGLK